MRFFLENKRPIRIAGPCSAETEAQVLGVAHALAPIGIDLFRAGIWKPRTRPGAFEGVGTPGLEWLKKVKKETGLKITIEVATAQHVNEAIQAGIDVLWIGARTTVNPFSVQEIADALEGVDIPVLIKNPVNPDLKLWIGAVERIAAAGVTQIAAVHRGFSAFGDSKYRNVPHWQIPIEFMDAFPDMPMICDISHICGRRDILQETAQRALDLNFNGLMTEVHPQPDAAWSDAAQQITPESYKAMLDGLVLRKTTSSDPDFLAQIENARQQIDVLDEELMDVISRRMALVREIGWAKKEKNVAILQPERWKTLIEACQKRGEKNELSPEFIKHLLDAIHLESIEQQQQIMDAAISPRVH